VRRRADHRHAAVHPRRRDYFKTDFFNAIGVELPTALIEFKLQSGAR